MTLAVLPNVPDEALYEEMTVFTNPLKTDPRYRDGIRGVEASMLRLSNVVHGSDWETAVAIIGDMAMCMRISCRDFVEEKDYRFAEVLTAFYELEVAVSTRSDTLVRESLVDLLKASGQIVG